MIFSGIIHTMNTEKKVWSVDADEASGYDSNIKHDIEHSDGRFRNFGRRILNIFSGNKEKSGEASGKYLLSEQFELYGKDKKSRKFWQGVYDSWDNDCGIDLPMEVGKFVEGYVNDPNYVFGVHHSYAINGEEYEDDIVLGSIMEDGLMNLGDASSGAFYKDPSVSKTVSFCPDMLHAVMQLKGSYKGSTGAVLVAIPSEYVDEYGDIKDGMANKVYNHNQSGYSYLKPEYILGFAQNLGRGSTIKFIPREDLLREKVLQED